MLFVSQKNLEKATELVGEFNHLLFPAKGPTVDPSVHYLDFVPPSQDLADESDNRGIYYIREIETHRIVAVAKLGLDRAVNDQLVNKISSVLGLDKFFVDSKIQLINLKTLLVNNPDIKRDPSVITGREGKNLVISSVDTSFTADIQESLALKTVDYTVVSVTKYEQAVPVSHIEPLDIAYILLVARLLEIKDLKSNGIIFTEHLDSGVSKLIPVVVDAADNLLSKLQFLPADVESDCSMHVPFIERFIKLSLSAKEVEDFKKYLQSLKLQDLRENFLTLVKNVNRLFCEKEASEIFTFGTSKQKKETLPKTRKKERLAAHAIVSLLDLPEVIFKTTKQVIDTFCVRESESAAMNLLDFINLLEPRYTKVYILWEQLSRADSSPDLRRSFSEAILDRARSATPAQLTGLSQVGGSPVHVQSMNYIASLEKACQALSDKVLSLNKQKQVLLRSEGDKQTTLQDKIKNLIIEINREISALSLLISAIQGRGWAIEMSEPDRQKHVFRRAIERINIVIETFLEVEELNRHALCGFVKILEPWASGVTRRTPSVGDISSDTSLMPTISMVANPVMFGARRDVVDFRSSATVMQVDFGRPSEHQFTAPDKLAAISSGASSAFSPIVKP